MTSKLRAVKAGLWPLLVLAATLSSRLGSMPGAFIYDDIPIILQNPVVQRCDLPEIWKTPYWQTEGRGLFRPLTVSSFCLDRSGESPAPARFHLTNIVLHLAGTALLFVLLKQLLPSAPALTALATAAFGVHPALTEAVNSIVGRAELLVGFFALCSLLILNAALEGKIRKRLAIPLLAVLYAAALFSKENGALLLPLSVLFIGSRRFFRPAGSGSRDGLLIPLFTAMLSVLAMGMVWRSHVLGGNIPTRGVIEVHGVYGHLAAGLQVIGLSIEKLFWPWNPQWDYDKFTTPPAATILGFHPLLAVCALSLVPLLFKKRSAGPVAMAWFLTGLLTSLQIIPTGSVFAERALYLPAITLIVGTAFALPFLHDFFTKKNLRKAFFAAAGLLIAGMAFRTAALNRYWRSDGDFWGYTIQKAPESVNAVYNMAALLNQQGRYSEAEAMLMKNLQRFPKSVYGRLLMADIRQNMSKASAERKLKVVGQRP